MRPLIVAAPASGSGKTSVTLGLMCALQRRGLKVAPFKVGPDFIDPGHHALVCGRPSHNLDGWLCSERQVRSLYATGCAGADTAIIEGVMGLYDGASGHNDVGSTAEIARWLRGRILLVVDARSQARSAAALVQGFVRFAPDLEFAGIVFNRVGSERHAELLREAHASVPGLPPLLGCLPRTDTLHLPERHLGLVTAESVQAHETYDLLADWVAAHLDLDVLAGLCQAEPTDDIPSVKADAVVAKQRSVRLGVARDEAFCFYYPDNLRRLEQSGAELVFFSPLSDRSLPTGLDGLYLGGGYPELYARQLADNRSLLQEIRNVANQGLPVYAECGGFMLLAEAIDDLPMAGVFPGRARLLSRRRALGYRQVRLTRDTLLGPAGTVARGHEFHYSDMTLPDRVERCYRLADRRGREMNTEGYCRDNVLGSYVHLHFASNPQLADHLVNFCRTWKSTRPQQVDK